MAATVQLPCPRLSRFSCPLTPARPFYGRPREARDGVDPPRMARLQFADGDGVRRGAVARLNRPFRADGTCLTCQTGRRARESARVDNANLTAALWIGLALVASLVSIRIGISVALIEIGVGIVAGNSIGLQTTPWIDFLASFGAVLLTFLAGAEIDPVSLRRDLRVSLAIGAVSFALPFAAAFVVAYFGLGWGLQAAEIAGLALSTTSVAVVYAVMIESGLAGREIGKRILAACFITDLGTVLFLGLLFAKVDPLLVVFALVDRGGARGRAAPDAPGWRDTFRIASRNPRSSSSSSSCSASADWPSSPGARPSCPPISWASPWPASSSPTGCSSTGCGRRPSRSSLRSTSSRPGPSCRCRPWSGAPG